MLRKYNRDLIISLFEAGLSYRAIGRVNLKGVKGVSRMTVQIYIREADNSIIIKENHRKNYAKWVLPIKLASKDVNKSLKFRKEIIKLQSEINQIADVINRLRLKSLLLLDVDK